MTGALRIEVFPRIVVLVLVGVLSTAATVRGAEKNALAQQILKETGVQGGLIVHLGCSDGKLTAALRLSDRYLV